MLITIFKSVLLMSAVGASLAVVLLCLKPITRKLFNPKWQYYIWLTVLIVMILPVRFNLPQRTSDTQPVQSAQNVAVDTKTAVTENQTLADTEHLPETRAVPKINLPQNIMRYLSIIWLSGVIFVLLTKAVKYGLFSKTIRKNSYADNTILSIPKRLCVRRTQMLDAPLIIGLIKPVLYLPDVELTENDMNYILMHELTHYRRHDLLYKWFAMLVLSVHWFNPLIYAVSKQIDLECEISCDASVTSKLTETEQNNYMSMILDMLISSKSKPRPLTTQMAGSKKILKRRFIMIRNKKKTSKFVSVLSAMLAVVMLGTTVFASGAANGILSKNISEWAKNDIKKAEEYAIINDSMDITDYTENITRSLFCDIAANVLVHNGVTLTAWEYPFTDVNEYGGSIHSLYCMGIVKGKTETEFRPNDYITREEAAAILYRMYKYTGLTKYYSETEKYIFEDDEDISDWAKDAVYALQLTHIINGIGNNTFDPKSHFTTEQAISSMVRLYDILNEAHLTVTNINRARQDIRVFYSCFNQREFDVMKNYCTQDCINRFFGDGYVFGMTQAALVDINFETNESLQKENKVAAFVTVNMTPHENSVFDPSQTETSFYMILQRQNDGSYLIDGFATGL